MIRETRNRVLTFAITLSCTAAAAIVGWQMLAGFVVGVLVTLSAAVLCGTDFD